MQNKRNNKQKEQGTHYVDNSCIERYAEEVKMSQYIGNIRSVLISEKSRMKKSPFKGEEVIKLDEYERIFAKKYKRQQENTVDCVAGLGKRSLLMIEMKFSVSTLNMKNVAKSVRDKFKSSLPKLRCSSNFCCLDKMVVLLSDRNFETQKSGLKRLLNMNNKFEILKVTEFYDKYFCKY